MVESSESRASEMKLKREQILNMHADDMSNDHALTPEQKLWIAVVERSVLDFKELFERISRQIERTGVYNSHYRYEFETMRYEFEHQSFKDACDFADLQHDRVLTAFNREAKASGLFDHDVRVPKFHSSKLRRQRGWH